MNKKKTKVLSRVTALGIVMTMALQGNVKAAPGDVNIIPGKDRYETAANVATVNWKDGSENVIIASGEGYPDSLSASFLAKKLNAPIILTNAEKLNTEAKEALKTLKAKNIYIVGGNGVVSQSIRDNLRKDGYTLTELGGKDRFATNIAIANYLVEKHDVKANEVLVVNGKGYFADALSVAPVAAAKGQILLIVGKEPVTAELATKFIQKHKSKATVIGTEGIVPKAVYDKLGAKERVKGGKNRFETNLNIMKHFKLNTDKLYVANATGDAYADALVASALAGKTGSQLILTNTKDSEDTKNAIEHIKSVKNHKTEVSLVGGNAVMPEDIVDKIKEVFKSENIEKPQKPEDLEKPSNPTESEKDEFQVIWSFSDVDEDLDAATTDGKDDEKHDYVYIKFNKPVSITGDANNVLQASNYKLNKAPLPKETEIKPNIKGLDDEDEVTDSITIVLPNNYLKGKNQEQSITISNSLENIDGDKLRNGGEKNLTWSANEKEIFNVLFSAEKQTYAAETAAKKDLTLKDNLNNAETAVEKAKALIKSLNNKAAGKSALEKRVNDVEKIIKNARIQFNENMNFEFSKGKITKYIGNKTDIIIPEKINGEKVTAIGKKVFTEKGLISVKIPDTVKNIGDGAFEKCASLKAIIIPNSIKSIGNDAFSGCTNLTSATIPEGLESIGEYAFYECSGLESVTIPSSVNRIGNHSFCYCDSITSLTISEGVKEIGFSAFLHCKSLPSVTIPKSVDVLDEWAFSGCDNLAAINVDKDNKNYSDIDGILFNKDKTIFIQYLDKHGDKYEVPEGVTKLAKGAFCDTKITSVTLPESLKIIGFSALQECPNLTSIEIPKNVTTIDHSAFSDSENLKLIFIPENVKTIKNYVFNGCTNLESVTIDNYKEAVNIGRRAIADSVKIIYLKEHLEENWGVEDFTFEGTSITGFSEKGNKKLKTNTDIVIPSTIGGKEVTAIGKKAFTEKGLISVKIPDTVKNIGEGAFEECKSLKSITIPEKVASIGNNAFENCTSLKSITIDNYQGAVTIGDNAFDNSINLNYLKKQPEGKIEPVVNGSVSATSITKGSKLADSNLSGAFKVSYNDDTEVEGDLKWKNPDTIVNEAGEFSWIFIPHDNKKYTEVEGVIKFKDGDNGKIEVDCG